MSPLAAEQPLPNVATDQVRLALAEALGTVAHDLRQPLSSIEAIAYYLSMVLPPGDAKIHAQLTRIRELVEQSNSILSSALGVASGTGAGPRSVAPEA